MRQTEKKNYKERNEKKGRKELNRSIQTELAFADYKPRKRFRAVLNGSDVVMTTG